MNNFGEPVSLPASDLPVRRRAKLRPKVRKLLAWCVHFYTATGLIAAAGMLVAILHGTPESFRTAFILMIVATLVDATDGFLARLVRVKEVLPGFDGRRLDDLIDFQTYVSLPLLLLWRAQVLPEALEVVLLMPLLAAAYGFCQVQAKTEDGFFLGFPSYWNLVAFYVYVLQPPAAVTVALLVGFSVLTLVPSRYLYPTMRGRLNRLSGQLGVPWAMLLVWILWRLPTDVLPGDSAGALTQCLALVSLAY